MRAYDNNDDYILSGKELNELQMQAIKDWIEQRKVELRKDIYDGDRNCPICKNNVKAHKVELSKSMINSLYSLYVLHKNNLNISSFHKDMIMQKFKLQSNVIGKLKHWRFVIQHKGGKYSITDDGNKFIEGNLKVNSYQWIYKDKKIRPKDVIPQVDIQLLITKFKIKHIK